MKLRGSGFNDKGYVYITYENRVVAEHILVCEWALGHALPPGVVVHHVDENKHNNANTNLVICEDKKYHHLLHARQYVVNCGGDPNTQKACRKCQTVRGLDDPFCEPCYEQKQKEDQETIDEYALTLPWPIREKLFAYKELNEGYPFDLITLQIMIRSWTDEWASTSEGWFMSEENTRQCLVPNCKFILSGTKFSRGLCAYHVGMATRLIRKGKTTWEKLEESGKCLKAIGGGILKDPEGRDWFLSEEIEEQEITQ